MDPMGAEAKESFLFEKNDLPVIEASLQKLKNDEVEQFGLLRSYLSYNNIDKDLSHRVTRFLQHAFDLKNRAISKDVARPWIVFGDFPEANLQGLQRPFFQSTDIAKFQ